MKVGCGREKGGAQGAEGVGRSREGVELDENGKLVKLLVVRGFRL